MTMEEERDIKATEARWTLSWLFSSEFLHPCIFRVAFYATFAAFGSITYLPLYFKQLGLDAVQVGVLSAVRPFIELVGSPLAGFIADKYKQRKLVIIVAVLAFMGKHLGILLIRNPHQTCSKTLNATQTPNITANMYDDQPTTLDWSTLKHQDEQPRKIASRETAGEMRRFVSQQYGVISHGLQKRKRRQINSVQYTIVSDRSDVERVFIEVLLIIVFCELVASSMMSLLDGAVVEYLGDNRNDYGKYRLYGSLGTGSSALLIGAVSQNYGYYFCEAPRHLYSVLFYFLFGFSCLALIALLFSKQMYSDARDQQQSGISKLKDLFCSIKNVSFWMAIISLAILDGFQMDFGPWFLDDLHTNSLMIGIATGAHFAVNACTYMVSPCIINKLGYMPVMSIGLFLHAVMFVLFSIAESSWFGVTIFALVGFVSSLTMSCGTTYIAMVSTPLGIVTTAQGVLNI